MFSAQQLRYQNDRSRYSGADADANTYFFRDRTSHKNHLLLFVDVIRDDIFKLQDAIGIWQSLHISQSAVHHAGSGTRQDFQLFAGFIYLVLGLRKDLLEFFKFVLHYTEDFPYFIAAALDSNRPERHLQAVEQGGHGAGAGDIDPVFLL